MNFNRMLWRFRWLSVTLQFKHLTLFVELRLRKLDLFYLLCLFHFMGRLNGYAGEASKMEISYKGGRYWLMEWGAEVRDLTEKNEIVFSISSLF